MVTAISAVAAVAAVPTTPRPIHPRDEPKDAGHQRRVEEQEREREVVEQLSAAEPREVDISDARRA
ncbi:hypothetical protein [Haloprofundus salilacus]|uniref:hypothetical protein n=1 Tax=Haloprofundus salilacus TaxID=2876190 RepID=UPI001CCA5A4B|nr:hypothetical protein [Haloprofundus salilacus]